jgi:GNAT superfamily N-acetyltransferase
VPEQIDFKLRFPKGDEDIISIFRFLVLVARPAMLGPIDSRKAVTEVGRIVMDPHRTDGPPPDSFAIVAEIDGELVGTIGVTAVEQELWYSKTPWKFMTNRWFFTYPALANSGIGAALLAEAAAMCTQVGFDLLIDGKTVRRNRAAGRGVLFKMPPQVVNADRAKQSMQ